MNSTEDSLEPGSAAGPAPAAEGKAADGDALFTTLYRELHRLARRELDRRNGFVTLSPTTLLHEAYVDMAARRELDFPDRATFMGYAARVMRGLIIDHARSRSAQKRGGLVEITSLRTDVMEQSAVADHELLQIGECLDELAGSDPRLSEVVDLKFFCGFSVAEIAALRGDSERTVQRDWEKARAYLHGRLRHGPG